MNEQRKQRFEQMGIPNPTGMDGVTTQVAKNKDMLLKLEQIKRGAKRSDFKEIIQKTEGIKLDDRQKERPQGQQQKGFQVKNNVQLESFRPSGSNSEAIAMEKMLYGEVPVMSETTPVGDIYGAQPTVDYKAAIEDRVGQKYPIKESNNPYLKNSVAAQQLTIQEERIEQLIVEKATKVATEIAKKTVKQIILEFAKSGKEILVESDRIKKAEIVAKDKVKINGKLYKLTEIKSE
jgi:hypothetical protein